jgi:hypothetical protein
MILSPDTSKEGDVTVKRYLASSPTTDDNDKTVAVDKGTA